jgi:hypothetical protein
VTVAREMPITHLFTHTYPLAESISKALLLEYEQRE